MPRDIGSLWKDRQLLVVGGLGGVGKTTTSAALAITAACQGRKVAVLTIDPARRLGSALGLKKLDHELRMISPRRLDAIRVSPGGTLGAAMLDVQSTFDGMVHKYAPSAVVRDRILTSRFYKEISQAMSGTHEYMALERIHDIFSSGDFDLMILDTPPSSAMTDIVQAPARLKAFLDREMIQWFFPQQGRGGFGLKGLAGMATRKGVEWGLSLLGKLAGTTILEDFAQFLKDFQDLLDGLLRRVEAIEALFASQQTTFALVTTSDPFVWAQTSDLRKQVLKERFSISGVIVNRTPDLSPIRIDSDAEPLEKALASAAKILQARHRELRRAAKEEWPGIPIFESPLLERDPTSLADLVRLFPAE